MIYISRVTVLYHNRSMAYPQFKLAFLETKCADMTSFLRAGHICIHSTILHWITALMHIIICKH